MAFYLLFDIGISFNHSKGKASCSNKQTNKQTNKLAKAIVLAAISLGSIAANASLIGDNLNVTYYFPTAGQVYEDLGTQTITAAGNTYNVWGVFDIYISNTNINVSFKEWSSFIPAAFNGFVITDLSKNFSSVYTIDPLSNMTGLVAGNVVTSGNQISVNWQGLSFDPNTIVTLSSNYNAVPEPESLALMGLGLLGMAAMRRKTKV